MGWKNTI
jgi:hypothetical protein